VGFIDTEEPIAIAVVETIHRGDVAGLKLMLGQHPELVSARLGEDDPDGMSRTLLHVVTDWPGHFPNGAELVAELVEFGADVNARFSGPHTETPLHWAASSGDIGVLDALLDAGANIEAPGSVIGGGAPLANATAFRLWQAAHRLVERGAQTTLADAATLGLIDRVESYFVGANGVALEHVTRAFWGACHGGQQRCAEYLLDRGADLNWIPPWEELTPLDAARRSSAVELAQWLRNQGAETVTDVNSQETGKLPQPR
jgi:hypothetical protein